MNQKSLKNWVEISGSIILSIAALSAAWCSSESALFGGKQATALSEVEIYSRKAMKLSLITEQHRAMDEDIIIAFGNAVIDNNQKRVDFYLSRVRPEMKEILTDWLKTNPLENKNAPLTPLLMPKYKEILARSEAKVDELRAISEAKRQLGQKYNDDSDKYVLNGMLFASVMFILGIASTQISFRVRVILTSVATVVFIIAIFFLVQLPFTSGG